MVSNWDRIRLVRALLLLRLSVAFVMLISALDKLLYPQHAAQMFVRFYHFESISESTFLLLGIGELFLVVLFGCGLLKSFSYASIFLIQLFSTLTLHDTLATPFDGERLLFLDEWPLLAVTWILYALRDLDTKYSLTKQSLFQEDRP